MPSSEPTPVYQVSPDHAAWFRSERGILSTTLAAYGVRSLADGAIALPYPKGLKLRYGIPFGQREFRYPTGQQLDFFRPLHEHDVKPQVLICEGETDAMRLWQELVEAGHADKYTVVGIPGVEAWTQGMTEQLRDIERALVFLDNDPPKQQDSGYTRSQVHRGWSKIRRALGAKAFRVDLKPAGVKDICEFFQRFDLTDMKGLIEREPEYHYPTIDFHRTEPVKVDWLVDGLIGKGDRAIIIGDPGAGKSWLAQALSVTIAKLGAGIEADWLGIRPDIATGRVLYCDEENPESEVYRRLQLLGLPTAAKENIRYVSQAGVSLDREPELLLDDAIAFRPDLIVLDSLARFHSMDEGSAGDMAKLFRLGLTPLARESGAAVLVLHHKIKPPATGKGKGGGLTTSRGSGDLTAVIDQGIDVQLDDYGTITLHHYKSRRSMPHHKIRCTIADMDQRVVVAEL